MSDQRLMQPGRAAAIAIACAVLTLLSLVAGVHGWRAGTATVLLLTATPMFAVLALAFGLLSRQRASSDARE